MMQSFDPVALPQHVAIIMDGNGRWAKKRRLNRIRGHEKGADAVRIVVQTSREIEIPWLTLYAFSAENWKRPKVEIAALMNLLKRFLISERQEMLDKGIRLNSIGHLEKLPDDTREVLFRVMEETAANDAMVLTLALSYGGRQEIRDAVMNLSSRVEKGQMKATAITEEMISHALYTNQMPDPDLLIRTSGEYRISNFLLWQIAYTEIYVTPTLWPDFGKEEYLSAIQNYMQRDRRFGALRD